MKRTVALVLGLVLAAPALVGCGADDDPGSGDKTTLTVFAASSLTRVFGELEKAYETDHPDVDVVISFDSSSTLAAQVTEDAPADVLATADQQSMQVIVDAADADGDPKLFATNTMAIVTPPDNPAGIESIDDLAGSDFVVCDPSAPCGAVAAEILDNAGVKATPASLEDKVTAVLSKVTLGEADAGLVYVSDAQGAGDDVNTVDIPDDVNAVTPYFIAAIAGSAHADLAAAEAIGERAAQRLLEQGAAQWLASS
jgi:molybdate transport system substrate-binding protein